MKLSDLKEWNSGHQHFTGYIVNEVNKDDVIREITTSKMNGGVLHTVTIKLCTISQVKV